jgi:hypothetical protein
MIKEKKHTGTVITSGTIPFSWRKFLGLFFLSAILIVSFWPIWQSLLFFSQPSFLLRMAVKAAEPQTVQLFYNTGSGFSQENSIISYLPGDGRFHDHFFPIPAQSIQGFRFDPAVSKDALAIKRIDIVMEITSNVHIAVKHIDLQNLMPVNQIKELTFKSGELTVLTEENANDPQIVIPVSFHSWSQSWIFWHLAKMGLKILIVGLLCGLLLWIWCRWDDQTSGIIAVIALIIFGLRCGSTYVSATSPMLNISVQSSTYGEMVLYYDLGQGLSENNSTRTIVYPDKSEHIYRMEIPGKPILNLRIDPPISKDTFVFGNISITDGLGHPAKPFHVDLKNVYPNEDISFFRLTGSMLSLQTKDDASDPQIHIPLAFPLLVKMDPIPFLVRIFFELLFISSVTMGAILFCLSAKAPNRFRWLLFAASVGVLFMRYPGIVLDPRFLAEEGSLFFQRAYNSEVTSLSSFFYNHEIVGYYNFIADFASWVAATFFPLPRAPYATLFVSFVFQIFPLYLIAMSRNVLWNSPLKRTMGILLVLLVPVSSDIWLTTIGTQYHLGLTAFLILLESGERLSRVKTWLYRAMLLVGGLSGVSSCLMTPFFFLKALHNRHRETLLHALLLAFSAALQLLSLWYSSNTRLSNLGDPASFIANMVNANFLSTLLGPTTASDLSQIIYGMIENACFALTVLLIVMLAFEGIFLFGLSRRISNPRLFFATTGALLITITVAYIGMINGKWETVDPYNAPRYFWLPNVILAFCVLFALKEQPLFSITLRGNLVVGFCLLLIVIQGVLQYDMAGYSRNMPSWKKEAVLWMHDGSKETIALWPQGWDLILKRKIP